MPDLSAWPALVLTAGLATRLRPVSSVRAKAGMPVAGKPLIGRVLGWLRGAGIRRVVLNLHHRPETITRVVGEGAEWDVEVRYSWESIVLGSAGGPRRARPLLDADRFLIVNGDTLTDCDLPGLVDRHEASAALVTMALVSGDVARYGGVRVGPDGMVAGFSNARGGPEAGQDRLRVLHFIGVQAVEASAFDEVSPDEPSETVRTLYPRLIARNPNALAAFDSRAEFLDIGTLADYHQTVARVAARERTAFDCGVDVRIHPAATVRDSIIWDRVTIGQGASLSECIVADEVEIPGGAEYHRCALVASASGLVVQPF